MAVVNLADEIAASVLQHAERLRGAVVAADAGAVESLRWAGALPILLRDLGVARVLSTAALWRAADQGPQALSALLQPAPAWQPEEQQAEGAGNDFIDHLVVLVSGFLWEYETQLQHLLNMGVVRRLTVCSSLSERAHECYDFGDRHSPQKMVFETFAATLAAHNSFQPRDCATSVPSPRRKLSADQGRGSDDEWGWGDDGGLDKEEDEDELVPQHHGKVRVEGEVAVVHMALNYAPLLHSKGPQFSDEPSLFVLSHPICATAFPLLLSRVMRYHQHNLDEQRARGIGGTSSMTQPLPAYSHVKEVLPDHIPSQFRRTLKLVAYALGELLVQAGLDTKDRIYAMGNTSVKIGHTLLKILNDLQEDLTTHAVQSHQAATVILVDRTGDLASPCSFGVSLLDRILALLPQSPHNPDESTSSTNRKGLHVTEIFPLHGSEPSPLSVTLPVGSGQIESYLPSSFVGSVKWKGGATLCHPRASHGMSAFRSLAFRPAKLALRDLDKRLQEVEKELVVQHRIPRSGSARRPGEKGPSTRGRDVVMRRMAKILEAGEPTNHEHSSLIELGIIVLETLERMEHAQTEWDSCRERVTRHVQLRRQGGGEWILPELADTVQRQFSSKSTSSTSGTPQGTARIKVDSLLALLVHAYALSSGSPIEDYSIQLIKSVLGESILESAVCEPSAIQNLFPELLANLQSYVSSHEIAAASPKFNVGNGDDEDWDWNESNSPKPTRSNTKPSYDDDYDRLQAREIVDTFIDRILSPLKECGQLFAKQHDIEYQNLSGDGGDNVLPRSLLAQLCGSLTSSGSLPSRGSMEELEHIVDASEQLTRAGIDLLKSGFSRFGFGGTGSSSGAEAGSGGLMGDSKILLVFVVGGVTFEEVQEVKTTIEGVDGYQVILGGTTITNSDIILEQLFR